MQHIKGFVCIAKYLVFSSWYREVLHGKSINNLPRKFNNFQSNGLRPFDKKEEALEAKKELEESKAFDLERVSLGLVEMTVAETEAEGYAFKEKRNLIVLKKDANTELIGRYIEGKPNIYPLKGAFLFDNGFKTFLDFESALYAAREVARQAQCPAALATFKLKRLLI